MSVGVETAGLVAYSLSVCCVWCVCFWEKQVNKTLVRMMFHQEECYWFVDLTGTYIYNIYVNKII